MSSLTSLRRCIAGALGAAALLAAAAAPAHATVDSTVASGPDGSAHFAYKQGLQIAERTLAGNGVLGGGQSVSWTGRNALQESIGVDAAGAAVVAWLGVEDGVFTAYARRRAADGSLSAIARLSPDGVDASDLQLAVEPDGDAVAVWTRLLAGKRVVQARRRAAGGALGPVQTVSYAGGDAYSPSLAVAPGGAATVAWLRITADGSSIQTRTVAPDGSLSDYQRLSRPSPSASDAAVTVDDAGTAVISWVREAPGGNAFESRARSASGVLGTVQTIAPADAFNGHAATGGNAAGRTAYAWTKHDVGAVPTIKARIRQANGTLGPVFDAGSGTDPRVAVDPGGNTTLAWRVPAEADWIEARRRSAAGAMGPVRTVSDLAVDSRDARLVVDGAGKATVTWAAGEQRYARTLTAAGAFSTIKVLTSGG